MRLRPIWGARKNHDPAKCWPREKTMTANDATISAQPRTEKAGCSASFFGVMRSDSGHRSVAIPFRRANPATASPTRPSRRRTSHGSFWENGMRRSCGSRNDTRKNAPKQSATSAFEAPLIRTSCMGVRLCNRGFMRGSLPCKVRSLIILRAGRRLRRRRGRRASGGGLRFRGGRTWRQRRCL